jgi:hypothetical protein
LKDSIKANLDAVFQQKDKVAAAAAKAKSEQEEREEAARKQFANLTETVIKPAMEQFAAYLRNKGHETLIWTEDERLEQSQYGDRVVNRDSVTMRISPDLKPPYRASGTGNSPHFAVHLEKSKGSVYFHESTMLPNRGGHSGSCGEVKLTELTADMLEAAIASTIAKTFK